MQSQGLMTENDMIKLSNLLIRGIDAKVLLLDERNKSVVSVHFDGLEVECSFQPQDSDDIDEINITKENNFLLLREYAYQES